MTAFLRITWHDVFCITTSGMLLRHTTLCYPQQSGTHRHAQAWQSLSHACISSMQLLLPGNPTRLIAEHKSVQESPARKITAHHQTDAWCTSCSARSAALELDLQKTKSDLEASKNSQGILKARLILLSTPGFCCSQCQSEPCSHSHCSLYADGCPVSILCA